MMIYAEIEKTRLVSMVYIKIFQRCNGLHILVLVREIQTST